MLEKIFKQQKKPPECLCNSSDIIVLSRHDMHTVIMDAIQSGVKYAMSSTEKLETFQDREAWRIINEDINK